MLPLKKTVFGTILTESISITANVLKKEGFFELL